ncbi:hypothetical protein CRE_09801 [Caenorhabditis remanei]|uniref:Sdz-33 F-box domain-containing protein n=1 Tax=Caenorhabditis remanei TaxID=31234 RepID=E3NDG8_CAERE|nr:hypothetical protein CRE_09801 [Caenorhabditis remanei]
MDPPKSFPILRLPFLAIEEVFKTMNPFEIIKSVVSCSYVMTSDKKMNGKMEETESGRYLIRKVFKYSKDPVDAWKQLTKDVLELFKKQTIDLLSMTIDVFIGQNVSIIDFLKANFNSELCTDVYINNGNFNGKIPKNLKELYINNSQWIGFEKSLNIDCKSVIFMKNQTRNVNLRNNHIFGEQWNSFLKKWIAMETHLNLEYMELEYRDFVDFNADVLYDIPHEVVDKGVKRVLKTRRNKTKKIRGMIDIKRIDGKTATIFVYRVLSEKRFAMSIH